MADHKLIIKRPDPPTTLRCGGCKARLVNPSGEPESLVKMDLLLSKSREYLTLVSRANKGIAKYRKNEICYNIL